MKKTLRILFFFAVILVVLLLFMVQRIDRTTYQETTHYAQWQAWIADKEFVKMEGGLQASWAKVNITPLAPQPMAGYGNRWGGDFEGVHDSLYVRVIALRNEVETTYFLSADMLIIPPNLTERLAGLLQEDGISLKQIYFGATHTHHSLGAWGQKIAGRLFGGKYDENVEIRLAELFREAIMRSQADFVEAELCYSQSINEDNVRNRLPVEDGEIDPWMRSLLIHRTDGKTARLLTYAAHPTVLRARDMQISRDFPGILVDRLEQKGEDFVMYMAGAVGSMGARTEGDDRWKRIDNIAENIIERLSDSAAVSLSDTIISDYFEIPMPEPTGRISINYALRPWVFKRFFGDYPTYIKVSKIGHALFIGVPADFSGEIMRELDTYADNKGIELIITSFNGGYIGYITPDRRYEEDLYETVTMSWNGYQSGGYFTQVLKDIIDKVAE